MAEYIVKDRVTVTVSRPGEADSEGAVALSRMRGGEALEGLLQMELPDPVNRASDFLNGSEDFFPLTAKDGTYLIQKHHAREILLFEASPVPAASGARIA